MSDEYEELVAQYGFPGASDHTIAYDAGGVSNW